jgi:hypothetical protein
MKGSTNLRKPQKDAWKLDSHWEWIYGVGIGFLYDEMIMMDDVWPGSDLLG